VKPFLSRLRRALCLSLLAAPLTSPAQSVPEGRADFAAQWAAPTRDASTDSAALRAYPLYPWLTAARLRMALTDTGTGVEATAIAAARDYLAQAGEVAHVRDLRRALLAAQALAGDRSGFEADWRETVANDTLRCQRNDLRRAAGETANLAQELAEQWLATEQLPSACAENFAWLKTQPIYTPALVERRVRARLLAGDSTRASSLIPQLPSERQARYEGWVRQLTRPASEFPRLASGEPQLLDSEGLSDSCARWARKAPEDAAGLLETLARTQRLSAAQKQTLQRDTAYGLALSRKPEAVALYRAVPETLLAERDHEWRIRAALWAGDWNQAFNWLTLLPEPLANQPRWRYWNARALGALGQSQEAQQRFVTLAAEHDTYGLLAASRANRGWTPINEPNPVTPAQRAALEATPAVVRAREAWRAGHKSIASLEWADALEATPAAARSALVYEAAAMGWPEQVIVTATKLGIFRDLEVLFPRPFAALVKQSALDAGIATAWVYSVMRKESAFKTDAVSSANAVGLLQMLPSTAARTAKAHGRPAPGFEGLKDPAINVPLGALHLREVLDQHNGRWHMALAAYNAGPNAVKRWLPSRTMDADVWIENIPFNETRTYIQRILFHLGVYQWLETGKPVKVGNWLPPVEPAVP